MRLLLLPLLLLVLLHLLLQAVVDTWHTAFLAVRERLERNSDRRWDFDRRVLFDRTDHISMVITDLLRVVAVSSEFSRFFRGNELKTVTNDPEALASITRMVDRLTAPLQKGSSGAQYCLADKSKLPRWRTEMAAFDAKVAEIEKRTETFIQAAFAQLRSAEGAFDLLQKFAHIEMRDGIREWWSGRHASGGRSCQCIELVSTAMIIMIPCAVPSRMPHVHTCRRTAGGQHRQHRPQGPCGARRDRRPL